MSDYDSNLTLEARNPLLLLMLQPTEFIRLNKYEQKWNLFYSIYFYTHAENDFILELLVGMTHTGRHGRNLLIW